MPDHELENMGLVEAVTEVGPSTLEYQSLSAAASVVNGEANDLAVAGKSPGFTNSPLCHHSKPTALVPDREDRRLSRHPYVCTVAQFFYDLRNALSAFIQN